MGGQQGREFSQAGRGGIRPACVVLKLCDQQRNPVPLAATAMTDGIFDGNTFGHAPIAEKDSGSHSRSTVLWGLR